MVMRGYGFVVLVLSGTILAGCGTTTTSSQTHAVSHTASSLKKTIDQVALARQLRINLNKGQLTASMRPAHGLRLVSTPLALTAALHHPTSHFGILNGPGWTLVFGVEPQGTMRVLVNGHHALQNPTPSTVKPGYMEWEYFLPGHVKPVVKTTKNT